MDSNTHFYKMDKIKILIAGIGGVGGYFGGLLAKEYENSDSVEVYFLARGAHLKKIKQSGLKVIKGNNEFVAKPKSATDDVTAIGKMQLVILCTKSYDLEATIQQLKPCINNETIILPLLNGVAHHSKIQQLLPDNLTLMGCVYIISRLKQDGVIENTGNAQKLFFGLHQQQNPSLTVFEKIFTQAGIEAKLTDEIQQIVWEKFIFISTTATATAYYKTTFGGLVADNDKLETVINLIAEIKNLADSEKINLPHDLSLKTINLLKSMPANATSSMQNDYLNQKTNTEIEALTGYVIQKSAYFGLDAPTYKRMYAALKS